MVLDVPVQLNGYACLTDDGTFCFGESSVECQECELKEENSCVPVVIEIIPTEEYADRLMQVESANDKHDAYRDSLEKLKLDIQGVKKSLENASKEIKGE